MRVTNHWECPIKGQRIHGDTERLWFVPPGKQAGDCTICQDCLPHLDDPIGYRVWKCPGSGSVTCDYNPPSPFDISILSKSEVIKQSENCFVLPSHTDYKINIILNGFDPYFTVDQCLVGGREVTLGDDVIYINWGITIDGFKPESKESFFFVGRPSSNSMFADVDKNNSTIILKLQRYKRVRKFVDWCGTIPRYECEFREKMQGSGGGFSFGSPSYGVTIDGGKQVDKIATKTTDDKFIKVGSQEVIRVLLLCSDSKEEIQRKHKEKVRGELEKKQRKLKRLREEVELLEKKI